MPAIDPVQQQELQRLLQRLINLTTPNYTRLDINSRQQGRANRSLPVLLAPWEQDAPCPEEAFYALTKDLAANGVCVLLHHPVHHDQFLLAFWDHGPLYALAEVRHLEHLGGPFWQMGLELLGRLHPADLPGREQLEPKVRYLRPRRIGVSLPTLP